MLESANIMPQNVFALSLFVSTGKSPAFFLLRPSGKSFALLPLAPTGNPESGGSDTTIDEEQFVADLIAAKPCLAVGVQYVGKNRRENADQRNPFVARAAMR